MKKITKVLLVLLVALMMLPLTVSAVADNETISNNLSISISTDKSEYKATNVAKITATITNTGSEDIENITAQAVFNDLAPAGKRTSETSKSVDVLKSGESFSFKYKATLNDDEHKLNIFQKIILFFVRLFNGGYNASNNNIDVVAECVTEIKFGKFTAENVVQVGYINSEDGNTEIYDEELGETITIVSEELKGIQLNESYNDLTIAEKVDYIHDKLNEYIEKGIIEHISFSEQQCSFYIQYVDGSRSVFIVESQHNDCYSSVELEAHRVLSEYNQASTISNHLIMSQQNNNDDWLFVLGLSTVSGKEDNNILSLLSLEQRYNKLGKHVKREAIATVETYTQMSGYELIYILSHGNFDTEFHEPYICTTEVVTKDKRLEYRDRYGNTILTWFDNGEEYFGIYPDFFEKNYSNNELNDSIILLGFCCGFGDENIEDNSFYESFSRVGANTVVGFCNAVNVSYSNCFMEKILFYLSKGNSIGLSYEYALNILGDNDNTFWTQYGTFFRQEDEFPGYPLILGDKNKKIFTEPISGLGKAEFTVIDASTKANIYDVAAEVTTFENGDGILYLYKSNKNGFIEIELPPGKYYCTLHKESYQTEKIIFIIDEYNTINTTFELMSTTIKGIVTDSITGKPIPNVWVEATDNNDTDVSVSDFTDKNGHYSIPLESGSYVVGYSHNDYKVEVRDVEVGMDNPNIDVNLTPLNSSDIEDDTDDYYTVTYTIFDKTTEQPILNVVVNVTEQGDNFDNVIESVTTDENGQITLALPEGDYALSLSHDNYQPVIVPVIFNAESTDSSIYLTSTRKVTASGNCGANGDNVTWTLYEDGELVISGSGDMADFDSGNSIPWYKHKTVITKATICKGITHLSKYAFSSCSNLTDIAISNTLTSIGTSAFSNCTKLINITIPDSVKTIGETAFNNCIKIENITIPYNVNKIGEGAFSNCKNLKNIVIPDNVLNIEPDTFENCTNLEDVSIGSGVKRIGDEAFAQCTNLVNVNIAEGVTSIGQNVFVSCKNLENIIIPDSVTSIGFGVFQSCKKLKNISISNNVTSIESSTFSNCSSLKSIIIPNNVKKIGQTAFYNCTNLQDITISNKLTTVGMDAFSNCQNLKNVYITDIVSWCKVSFDYPTSNPLYYNANLYVNGDLLQELIIPTSITEIFRYAFIKCNSIKRVTITDNVANIGVSAFNGCTNLEDAVLSNKMKIISGSLFNNCSSLKNITIPSSITVIDRNAFNGCSNLKNITIPNSVTSIGDSAFCGCTNLSTIAIPDSITKINPYTFRDCANIESVTIPNSVTNICSGAFYNCSSIEILTIPNSVTNIGGSAFRGCSSLKSITIPERVTIIENALFYDCSNLISVTIPNSVTKIGSSVFRGCSSLKNITIPERVTIIENALFYDCINLISVNIPNSVTIIGNSAFRYCKNITDITLPNNITSIGEYAFDNCYSLKTINIPDSVTSLGRSAFSGCTNLESIIIPYGITNISKEIFYNCTNLQNIVIPNSVTNISEYAFYGCNNLSNIAIPNSVTSIGNNAFVDCDSLLSIEIPNSVTTIENSVFRRCDSLNSVIMPDSVISIGEDSFSYCISLKHITIPNSVTSIGECAFFGCKNLSEVNLSFNITKISSLAFSACNSLARIIIPNGVMSIDDSAFLECENLKSITIPKSVTYIGTSAFSSCTNLTNVYYAGNASEWNRISIYNNNSPLINATIHYNS